MAKPNLALIPATIGDKVYSILPSDGVGDFDFTRASTATRINAQGLIETVASGENRLNYSLLDGEVIGCPHLLLEPARTNSAFPSENFSGFGSGSSTIVTNESISPDGTMSADKIYPNSNGSYIGKYLNIGASTTGVVSCFVKQSNKRYAILGTDNNATYSCIFDLQTGTVSSQATNYTAKIENYGNGWYRISAAYTSSAAAAYPFIGVADATNGSVTVDNTNGLFIWGFQYELNASYPTSYIPTQGSAVTRAAETCNGSGNAATFNDSEGVLMVEASALANENSEKAIAISDGSFNNRINLRITSNNIRAYGFVSGANDVYMSYTVPLITSVNKIAFKYKENDFSLCVNGFEVSTDTSGSTFSEGTLSELNFDAGSNSALPFYGKTKQIQYHSTVLTDSNLEKLTSWTSFEDMAQSQLYTIE